MDCSTPEKIKEVKKDFLSHGEVLNFEKHQILCVEGARDCHLYFLLSGKFLVVVNHGTKITPVAEMGQGEFLGELSFFDFGPRSATVICIEPAEVLKVSENKVHEVFPPWVVTWAQSMSGQIRELDEMISKKGIRRKKKGSVHPLTIEEQRLFYQRIQDYREQIETSETDLSFSDGDDTLTEIS